MNHPKKLLDTRDKTVHHRLTDETSFQGAWRTSIRNVGKHQRQNSPTTTTSNNSPTSIELDQIAPPLSLVHMDQTPVY